MNVDSKETPIVMLHGNQELFQCHKSSQQILIISGFAAGIAFWVMNLEEISVHRPLYAIDLLGFGRSSRSSFSKDAHEIEQQVCLH